jgi:hypothetical protein
MGSSVGGGGRHHRQDIRDGTEFGILRDESE